MRVELKQGDITDQKDIDAIVNAANTQLWLGSGVAGAIRNRGGEEIEKEAVSKGPIRLGEAVSTTAGRLPNKFVIHAAAMGYRPEDQKTPKQAGSLSSDSIIRDATRNSLTIADQLVCKSIAFPALATGVGGFPVDECARVMIKAAFEFGKSKPETSVKLVRFVLFGGNDYNTFENVLKEVQESDSRQ